MVDAVSRGSSVRSIPVSGKKPKRGKGDRSPMEDKDEETKDGESKTLTDQTKIAGTTWAKLKTAAMRSTYRQANWFVSTS